MLYEFLVPLSDGGDMFNLFRYITFRSGGAFMTALIFSFIFGRPIIDWLGRRTFDARPHAWRTELESDAGPARRRRSLPAA